MKKYVSHIIVVLPWVIAMLFINRAPDTLAIHYNVLGNVDNYASKEWVVLSMGVLVLIAHIVIRLIINKYPKQFGINSVNKKMYQYMMPFASAFLMWCLVGKYLI